MLAFTAKILVRITQPNTHLFGDDFYTTFVICTTTSYSLIIKQFVAIINHINLFLRVQSFSLQIIQIYRYCLTLITIFIFLFFAKNDMKITAPGKTGTTLFFYKNEFSITLHIT